MLEAEATAAAKSCLTTKAAKSGSSTRGPRKKSFGTTWDTFLNICLFCYNILSNIRHILGLLQQAYVADAVLHSLSSY